MKRLVPIMAALALSACGRAEPDPAAAQVRLAAVPGRPAAGYFTLRVEGDRGALISVRSPQAGRIEMHETMSHGSVTSMRPVARVAVQDGETLAFTPGGRHLMLYDLAPTVEAGGAMSLILRFERGGEERLTAGILAAGDEGGH
jgi:copper(I)-binding protein